MKNSLKNTLIGVGGAVLLVLVLLAGLQNSSAEKPVRIESGSRTVMGTFANLTAIAEDAKQAEQAIEAGFDELVKVDNLMSDYKPESEVSRINRTAFTQPVKVSDATFEVLEESVRYSKMTDGAFDITVGGVVHLWRKVKDGNLAPDKLHLEQVRRNIGWEYLVLNRDKQTVRFQRANIKIDLGGIAKGYGIDRAVETMKNAGAAGGIVDVGGDVRCFGKLPEERRYRQVAIRNPKPSKENISFVTLKVKSGAVATSGDYRRFYEREGKIYSHIIAPNKGWSADMPSSVTVIAEEAMRADVFATAVSVMGVEKGLEFINNQPDAEAIIIETTPEGKLQVHKSDKAQGYIK